MSDRSPLAMGDEAWSLLWDDIGDGERKNVTGAARVHVIAIDGDCYRVVVVAANPEHAVGRELERDRGALYATSGAEHAAFGELVQQSWADRRP